MSHFTDFPDALDFIPSPSSLLPDEWEAWLASAPIPRPLSRLGWGQALRQIATILRRALRG